MIAISTTGAVVAAIQQARSVAFTAYVLRPGQVLASLEGAAARGAHVFVRLEGQPYADKNGELLRGNRAAIAALRAHGADAALTDGAKDYPLHLKAAVVDGDVAYLDDRNWPGDGMDTILRDDYAADVRSTLDAIGGHPRDEARLATQKDAALVREARTIYHAANTQGHLDVESESFGFGRVSAAVLAAADRRAPVRLIVALRDLSARSRSALQKLLRHGVRIRVSASDEKMAVTRDQAWLGSIMSSSGVI